jgi:hypothetical protein
MKSGYAGSALCHLKEAWWMECPSKFDATSELKELKQRLIAVYTLLGKSALADILDRYFAWLKK